MRDRRNRFFTTRHHGMRQQPVSTRFGFTLIELSIVLIIIGLVTGAILVGRNMIRAAEVRATITQIDKYQTAVNTFRLKYGYLPGDIPDPTASAFGFVARGSEQGQGDGNGVIEGWHYGACGNDVTAGETALFWEDLGKAGLSEGNFNTATATSVPSSDSITGAGLNAYFPTAKMGNGNYIYVWSGGWSSNAVGPPCPGDGLNYFGLSAVYEIRSTGALLMSNNNITVSDAYNIDQKMDDGLPQSGNVLALVVHDGSGVWAKPTNSGPNSPPFTTATAGSPTSCFDNSNPANGTAGVDGAAQHYSLEFNHGDNPNCGLSFRFH